MKKSGVQNADQNCKNGVKTGKVHSGIFADFVTTQKREKGQK